MQDQTFHSRLIQLLQKSKKALRLYSSAARFSGDRFGGDGGSEFSEAQIAEWKAVNTELIRQLTVVLERGIPRNLPGEVVAIRDYFYRCWRGAEADLHVKQKDLIASAEAADFVRAALLSDELVILKARTQASQAACHELNEVIKRSKFVAPTVELSTVELSAVDEITGPIFGGTIELSGDRVLRGVLQGDAGERGLAENSSVNSSVVEVQQERPTGAKVIPLRKAQ